MKGSKRRGKRPGTWELRVEGGCDPLSGKRVQRSLTFEGSAREADSRLAELSVEISRQPIIGGSRTMTELIRAGLEQAEAEGLEATTLRGYRRCATRYILPAFGTRRIGKITTEEIDRFYRALAKEGYAHSTVKQTHVVLCRVFDTAIRWRWIGHNPARSARPPRIAKIDPKPVPVEMIGALLTETRKTYPELATCIVLAADTGMRQGELCALRWSRVDLEAARCASTARSARRATRSRRTRRTISTEPSLCRAPRSMSYAGIEHVWPSVRCVAECPFVMTRTSSLANLMGRRIGGRRISITPFDAFGRKQTCRTG